MRVKRFFISALLMGGTLCLPAANWQKVGNGVLITTDNGASEAKVIRLQVMGDNIIKVEATPESQIPKKRKSLVVVDQKVTAKYTVSESGDEVTVAASGVQARVNTKTGRICFYDGSGKQLLQETATKGKTFKKFVSGQTELPANYHPTSPDEINWGKKDNLNKISLEDRSGYTWHLQFDGVDGEAIYGLGQHQSEEMNYKGKNEELFQYNTKVAVPFVMSTAGYGLLWDSYSYGRWGNPNNYQQLGAAFTLYNKEGKRGTITGTYTDAKGKQIVRQEDSLYYENLVEIEKLPKGFNMADSRVVYEGFIEAPISAEYDFILYYSGYMKVFIDGHNVVPERWRTAWNPNAYKFSTALLKGRKTRLRIEWQPNGGVAYCGLRAAVPQTEAEKNRVSIWSEMTKDMTFYFIAGENMDKIIKGYRQLTGKSPVVPKWSLGFWQSRERYQTQQQVEETMQTFRDKKIPCDVIVQDWFYWKEPEWGSFSFDPERFPNPQGMYDKVHSLNGRLMISCWPKYYWGIPNCNELDANGWIYKQPVNDSIRDWVGPGYVSTFYDAYSAGARKMFWKHMDENLYSKYGKGMDAWWMDASEPNIKDCTPLEYRKLLCGPTALGTSDEYFNSYSIPNADAIYNGQRSISNNRVFLLTRSGFAGEQRYSTATWSGDIGTRWEDMRAQMTAGLNFSMAGIPFWGMDQGGFCVEDRYVAAQNLYDKKGITNDDMREWRELQARWNQFGCFVPLYRAHGQFPLREVWNIAPENDPAYKTIVAYDKLRYRMMPYIYSMAGWVNRHDYTIMRGLAMDFGSDANVHNIGNQWMFGPAFMACPVGEYKAREREVYFPAACGWYDLYTGKHIAGGQTLVVDAPFEKIPVFVREGAIIPFGPEMQWSDEKPAELINLYIYAGADGKFELYEDEGTNYNYEKGKWATIDITYDDAARTVTFGKRIGSFPGMLKERRFNVVLVSKDGAKALDLENPQGKMVDYSGKAVTVKL